MSGCHSALNSLRKLISPTNTEQSDSSPSYSTASDRNNIMRADKDMQNQILFFTLQSAALELRISNFGARLISVKHRGDELLYGPKSLDELIADQCYCGAICGRVANRIAGGHFELNGESYQLPINNSSNHLHGGISGFSDKIWEVIQHDEKKLILQYNSPDGEEGYPGNMLVKATYSLDGSSISLKMDAECDAASLLNLTNHAYWNLSDEPTIMQHSLQINTGKYTPIIDNIPTGSIESVENSPFDLQKPKILGDCIGANSPLPLGYDDNFCIQSAELPFAILKSQKHELRISSDAPAVQVYSGYYLPLHFGGIAIEAQGYPDAPHHPQFPSIQIEANKSYTRRITWEIRPVL